MLDSVIFKVKFSKEISEKTPTTPGGFKIIRKDGKIVSFDFESSATEYAGNYRIFYMDDLDLNSIEGSETITVEDIINMQGFEDIFVDLDECPEGTKVEKIINFEFRFFANKNLIKINVNQSILDAYNEGM